MRPTIVLAIGLWLRHGHPSAGPFAVVRNTSLKESLDLRSHIFRPYLAEVPPRILCLRSPPRLLRAANCRDIVNFSNLLCGFAKFLNFLYLRSHMAKRKAKMSKFDLKGQGRFTSDGFQSLPFFGGSFCTTRKHRTRRPLSTKEPMHLVLRSTMAVGKRSFLQPKNKRNISNFLIRLAKRWGITIEQIANVGNHLHLLIRIKNLKTYKPFICALTGGIAILVTGGEKLAKKFWDFRPYSRVVYGLRGLLKIRDYILINQLESSGTPRCFATVLVENGAVVASG